MRLPPTRARGSTYYQAVSSTNPREFGMPVSFDRGLRDTTSPEIARANKLAMRQAAREVPVDFAQGPIEYLDPYTLRATQPWLQQDRLDWQRKHYNDSGPVRVIEAYGVRYVKDGHHRAQVAAERGTPVPAVVVRVNTPARNLGRQFSS